MILSILMLVYCLSLEMLMSFARLSHRLFGVLLICRGSLYILNISPLPVMCYRCLFPLCAL